MKTEYFKDFYIKLKYTLSVIFLFLSVLAQAQVDEEEDNEAAQDTIKGYNSGKVELKNPTSIVGAYSYDPVTNRYIYTNKFEGFNINYPIILTPDEYQELVLRESIREYYQQKSKAIDGKGTEKEQKDLLPRYYVNSSFFETIFGGNTIDVKPQGSVEMDLGVRYTKQDNPSLSPRNRKTFTFDFDQRISMSLQGKVGTRLGVTANYDTESTFAFQNLIKLEYTPTEDDIIQKIEVGNVSFPLSNSLVRGAQSLFGVKGQFQFGRTTVTGIYSEQKSQTKTVTAQGGGTVQDFELFALDYDADRHYFLSQYFRNRYDAALRSYPLIDSRVQITRIEVWVTNKQNRINATENNSRNILALQDLGESQLTKRNPQTGNDTGIDISDQAVGFNDAGATFYNVPPNSYPDNANNKLDPAAINSGGYLNSSIREIVTTDRNSFNTVSASEGTDYAKLENARKLTTSEYTYNTQLGYISLNQKLNNDEVLAVAYQYTVGDQVFQVGEFGTDGVAATNVDITTDPTTGVSTTNNISTQSLILKMLKGNLVKVNEPVWDLMMKNVYQIPNAYQLSQEDFRFNIMYTDPSPLNYITPFKDQSGNIPLPLPNGENGQAEVADTPLLRVFNVDRLTYANDPQVGGDGFFDFVPGMTVDTQNGRIIFTTVEPFGEYLYDKLGTNTSGNTDYHSAPENTFNPNQQKYVYRDMYKSTQASALQQSQKNKFQLKGRYKSTGANGISLGAFNVPQGSVVVTAGGRTLVEGQDYTVNYQAGTVQILDTSLQASNTPIEVSTENNATFGQQTRRFYGVNVEHKFSDKFLIGGTILKMSERPFTSKTNYGQESVNNTIYGFNTTFSTEVPFFTRLVNKLPTMDTDVPSNFSFRGEIAYLKPGASKADQFNGEATTYVDDFEGTQTTIDVRAASGWSLSSVPWEVTPGSNPPVFIEPAADISTGHKRAKLAWYSIDPVFYTNSQRPTGISDRDVSSNVNRRIYYEELYPVTDVVPGSTNVVTTLDLSYFPQERGPYNYNPIAAATNGFTEDQAVNNWAGIMRSITSTNFEQTNVEYIQFWMMDPYAYGASPDPITTTDNTGTFEIHLGELSEDILKDNRKQYENGLPGTDGNAITVDTDWGKVPVSQSLIYAFDTNSANRGLQDVGLDGLNDAEEAQEFPDFRGYEDPAADNYQFFLSASGNVVERYKNYNGTQGNSPVDVGATNRGSTTLPDVEDINKDNTMNTIDAYFRYTIPVEPNATPGTGYVVDERPFDRNTSDGGRVTGRWLLYKVPIDAATRNAVNGISDVRSIRFMRLVMTGFRKQVTLRIGAMDLVRSEWRRYTNSMDIGVDEDPNDEESDYTGFDVVSLNVQENGDRRPIPYKSPPGVVREQLYSNNAVINQNEQALSLRVYATNGSTAADAGLEPGDSRAVFKNVNVDMRQYKKLRMFLHAEALPLASGLPDDILQAGMKEIVGFLRFGNDFTDNFYQIERPLVRTEFNSTREESIWPEENEINVSLDLLTKLKIMVLQNTAGTPDANGVYYKTAGELDPSLSGANAELIIGIKGNPNFGFVRTLMVGIKNPLTNRKHMRGEVWFNELRLSDMDNKGGMAAVASMDTNFADLLTLSATGNISTIGFGTIEQSPNERSREDTKQYNLVTNINAGKLLPKKWGMTIPFNYSVGEQIITPEYDPFYQDVKLDQLLDITQDEAEKENIKNRAIDYTKTKSINFIGVKKERSQEQKQHVYDPENLTLGYSFNQTQHHDYEIEDLLDQQVRATADYSYAFQNKPVEPFKNTAFMKKSQYWKMLSDFNFNYLPSNISFSSNIIRQYNRQQYRNVDVDGIAISPLYRRNYFFNYQYGFNYNITKSLKFNYSVATSNIVRNYLDEDGAPIQEYTVFEGFWDTGTANSHTQQFVINYDLPINKIPALSFIKSTYSYTGNYNWQRSTDALAFTSDGIALGNTIQNANSHKLNASLTMDMFYKYIGLGPKKKAPAKNAAPKAPPKPGEKITAAPKQEQSGNVFVNGLLGIVTSVKNININYTETNGTQLPGFLPGIGFLGTTKPSLGFVWGSQADVRYDAARAGYLTGYQDFNQNYTQVNTKDLKLAASVDLFPDFKIELTADKTSTDNYSEQYDVTDGLYNPRSPYNYGNFQVSTILIRTAFSKSDVNGSAAFDQMRENRMIIANRLAEQYYGSADAIPRYISTGNSADFATANAGYPEGFGKNSQSVLLPAFLAAYTGQDAGKVSTGIFRDVPLPNWVVKYTGLMRYTFFKEKFKSFSIHHGYRASYNINAYRSNFEFNNSENNGRDNNGVGNFYTKNIISNINLAEQFNPLIRVDMTMKNSFKVLAEVRKDRTLNMSFDNNLLTEVKGNEYIVGLGYRIKDVIINSSLADNPTNTIKSDINIKADFTLRKNETIVRYLDYDNNQLGGGQNIWTVKLTADYAFSKNLTAIFYYDHSFSKAVISTAYPITNIRAGFTLRYNFGN
ncbi:cell surface protein SprA [Flavobacterium sp. Sd200]|uniref:T9SS outer membrane translocon Sov/SprA n=1 Tax=Flavobacterium sp. Sd200 TaxID=2692211 RepID=UPI001369EAAB|nr:cell surface protein SprA [Flavobacterium sp. Sd200]MXN92282.1 cell surface protein SprA [Flavobacterium sp. Sd200]